MDCILGLMGSGKREATEILTITDCVADAVVAPLIEFFFGESEEKKVGKASNTTEFVLIWW